MTTTTCPAECIGREMGTLIDAMNAADDRGITGDEIEKAQAVLAVQRIFHRINALSRGLAAVRATTPAGALAQVVVASGWADQIAGCDMSREEAVEKLRDIEACLYSAAMLLEQLAGVSRDDMGAKYFMPEDLNPHTLETRERAVAA